MNILPKELIYEISYYLEDPYDILSLSNITEYFKDYYFWENYIMRLDLIFIRPPYIIKDIDTHYDWLKRTIYANNFSNEFIDKMIKISTSESFMFLGQVSTDILFRLDIPKLKNLAIGSYRVDIKCIERSKIYLEVYYTWNKKLDIEVFESDVRKLLVLYKYYDLNLN